MSSDGEPQQAQVIELSSDDEFSSRKSPQGAQAQRNSGSAASLRSRLVGRKRRRAPAALGPQGHTLIDLTAGGTECNGGNMVGNEIIFLGSTSPNPRATSRQQRPAVAPGSSAGCAAGSTSPKDINFHYRRLRAQGATGAKKAAQSPGKAASLAAEKNLSFEAIAAQPSPAERKPQCAVCLEDMKEPACGPCGHCFCKECLVACVKATKKCPTCRKNIQIRTVKRIYL
eukprot:jgi/Astpho2/8571/fgenesh1_pg.00126_%23_2_t